MKTLIQYFTLLFLICCSLATVHAQTTVAAVNPENKIQLTEAELQQIGNFGDGGFVAARSFDGRYEGIKGSPLWKELGFSRALVKFRDQEELVDIDANLDLEKHMVYLRLDKTQQIFNLKANKIEYVQFQDGSYPFYSIRNKEMADNDSGYAFAQLIHQGKYSLVKVTNKKMKKADFQDPYSTGTTYDEYLLKEHYWISSNGRTYKKMKLNKKGFQKALAKKAKAIGNISKDNNLDLKNEKDAQLMLEKLEDTVKK